MRYISTLMLVAEELDVSLKQCVSSMRHRSKSSTPTRCSNGARQQPGVVDLGLGCVGWKISTKSRHTRQFLCMFASNSIKE
jgi:hypothetical protein